MGFTPQELEMIQAIRDINGDQTIDAFDALESYCEMIQELEY